MKRRFVTTLIGIAIAMVFLSCSGGNPTRKGAMAGKESCECYKLSNQNEIDACLDRIEEEYSKYLTDSAFTNAVEKQLINCITEDIEDFEKVLHEYDNNPKPKATTDTTPQNETK